MKLTITSALAVMAALSTNLAMAAPNPSPDNNLFVRDVCGSGYPGYTRRIGSPCAASNGLHEFCSCDRTNIARCRNGKWTDGPDCEAGGQQCYAREDGARAVCV